ncbi:hypothetical protein DVH24_018551 [Malus domestica]|uniref:Uncharacterized protein n=1 Tax=Malus domestica TaxID=3750 RepID=A0A498HI97_MALDO|nr:hypothetical protein DVH24_018551 [Malus domestica]
MTKLTYNAGVSLFRGLVTNLQTLLDSSYPVDDVKNEKGQTLLQIATECRHHKVYNFIYDQLLTKITPLSQIDHIQGAALQMKRELQWFKLPRQAL